MVSHCWIQQVHKRSRKGPVINQGRHLSDFFCLIACSYHHFNTALVGSQFIQGSQNLIGYWSSHGMTKAIKTKKRDTGGGKRKKDHSCWFMCQRSQSRMPLWVFIFPLNSGWKNIRSSSCWLCPCWGQFVIMFIRIMMVCTERSGMGCSFTLRWFNIEAGRWLWRCSYERWTALGTNVLCPLCVQQLSQAKLTSKPDAGGTSWWFLLDWEISVHGLRLCQAFCMPR